MKPPARLTPCPLSLLACPCPSQAVLSGERSPRRKHPTNPSHVKTQTGRGKSLSLVVLRQALYPQLIRFAAEGSCKVLLTALSWPTQLRQDKTLHKVLLTQSIQHSDNYFFETHIEVRKDAGFRML